MAARFGGVQKVGGRAAEEVCAKKRRERRTGRHSVRVVDRHAEDVSSPNKSFTPSGKRKQKSESLELTQALVAVEKQQTQSHDRLFSHLVIQLEEMDHVPDCADAGPPRTRGRPTPALAWRSSSSTTHHRTTRRTEPRRTASTGVASSRRYRPKDLAV